MLKDKGNEDDLAQNLDQKMWNLEMSALSQTPDRKLQKLLAESVKQRGNPRIRHCYDAWSELNRQHFGGKLKEPAIMLGYVGSKALAKYYAVDSHGIESLIVVGKATLYGAEDTLEGILMHEMAHQEVEEVLHTKDKYDGHGPLFAGICNRIGAELGLPKVGVKGRGGLPDCRHWPHISIAPAPNESGVVEDDDDADSDQNDEDERDDNQPTEPGATVKTGTALNAEEKLVAIFKTKPRKERAAFIDRLKKLHRELKD